MISISVVNSDKSFDRNYMFSQTDESHLLYPLWYLKKELKKRGVDIHTSDILPKEKADYILYNEYPKNNISGVMDLPSTSDKNRSFLLSLECPIIRPENYKTKYHSKFKKVLTWHDDLVASNDTRYVKSNFCNNLREVNTSNSQRSRFLVCIAGNKKIDAAEELYSERRKVVEWFESTNSSDFDLYGNGWGSFKVNSNRWYRPLNRIFSYLPVNRKTHSSWKGRADNKIEVLSKYKFNLCFENAKSYPGYITEKIFDSFFAGTVPVYWGAPNIERYIPADCYIDFRKFNDVSDCYDFLKTVTDDQIIIYQQSMQRFLESEKSYQFSMECFVNTILSAVGETPN